MERSYPLIAFALATDYGLTKEFFWPQDASLWSDIANFIGYSSAAATMLLFMRQMIRTYLFVPRLDTLVLATVGLNLRYRSWARSSRCRPLLCYRIALCVDRPY